MSEYPVSPTELKKERKKEKSQFLTVSGLVCSQQGAAMYTGSISYVEYDSDC